MRETHFKPGELVRPKRFWNADLFDGSSQVPIQNGQILIFVCVCAIKNSVQIEFVWIDSKGRLLSDKWLKGTAADTSWRKKHFF